jgi:hypothetical protein
MSRMVLAGAVFMILGLVLVGYGVVTMPETRAPATRTAPPVEATEATGPGGASPTGTEASYAMPILGGLLLAGGGAMIGIGLGRWRHPRPRGRSSDVAVQPESTSHKDRVV